MTKKRPEENVVGRPENFSQNNEIFLKHALQWSIYSLATECVVLHS